MKKKLLSILLMLSMIFIMSLSVFAAEGTISGEGTVESPYLIEDLADLKAFRDAVNGGTNYSGKYVKLNVDIDLNSEEWTPIGNSTNKFQGTFDGNGKTISNLVITGNNSNVGLFGFTTNGEIKNLTVNNAKVSGYLNVGVVAGTPYTSKYTNISVTGHVEVNGYAYVGGVGGKNAYANWTNVTVNVDESSYVNAESENYRTYVGGVIGFMGEGNHVFDTITSNIDVIGSTCDVGGITGIAHYGNTFKNISCSGDVTLTNAGALEDAQEVGGIAGVWHNQDGTTVTFENVSYTGTVSSTYTDENGVQHTLTSVELENGGVIGSAYNDSGSGTIGSAVAIANGTTYTSLEAAISAAADGSTVTLLKDLECVSVRIEKPVTLNLNGKTLTTTNTYGGIIAKNNCSIVNGTLNHTGKVAAIKAWEVEKIEGVTINVTPIEGKVIGGIVVQESETSYVGLIKDVTITGATNGIETYRCGTHQVIGEMNNVTIDALETGMLLSAPSGTAVNCNISGGTTGIDMYLYGPYSVNLILDNCNISGGTNSIYLHDEVNLDNPGTAELVMKNTTLTNGTDVLPVQSDFEEDEADKVSVFYVDDNGENLACGIEGEDGVVTYYENHSFGVEWFSDETGHWHKCVCGTTSVVTSHENKVVIDKEATTTEKGSKHEECTICGYKSKSVEIPALGTSSEGTSSSEGTASSNIPKTGDNANTTLWITLMIAAAVLMGTTVVVRKRH